jgi:hypothetical protein
MKDFRDYYKFPLKKEDDYRNVFTSDNRLAFQFLISDDSSFLKFDDESQQVIVDVINGEKKISHLWTSDLEYRNGNVLVDNRIVLTVRGWGMLTGVGAYNLPSDEAAKIQDDFGQYITNKLNEQ